jgi:hypothetical protein
MVSDLHSASTGRFPSWFLCIPFFVDDFFLTFDHGDARAALHHGNRRSLAGLPRSDRERIMARETDLEMLAKTESDCSSAKKGGALGPFGPGQMQRMFFLGYLD